MVAAGYLLFFLFRPLIAKIPLIHDYTSLIYLYVLTSCLRSLCSQFIRARELVRLYAFDGVLSIITVITCNILFLSVLKLGITGYVLATIISDALSCLPSPACTGISGSGGWTGRWPAQCSGFHSR